ncbi:hypothetical protein CDL12_00642 [Handroanthus impetiginosus]|uniref:Uncharacterized protein n=1 Tax=Handroanthus impetiginosus TaxID=429701 RepID=A0A2G9IA32_9LAMI|nr:hypothetical protein CDL12_00642 [Handroanthus impetiginosus]
MDGGDWRSQLHPDSRQGIVNKMGEMQLEGTETGDANGEDWQEEIYQKIKSMNEMYFPELNEMYQRMAAKLQQHDALPQQARNEHVFKVMLEHLIIFLQTNKNDIQPTHKDKIPGVEMQIINILNAIAPRRSVSSLQQG